LLPNLRNVSPRWRWKLSHTWQRAGATGLMSHARMHGTTLLGPTLLGIPLLGTPWPTTPVDSKPACPVPAITWSCGGRSYRTGSVRKIINNRRTTQGDNSKMRCLSGCAAGPRDSSILTDKLDGVLGVLGVLGVQSIPCVIGVSCSRRTRHGSSEASINSRIDAAVYR